MKSPLARSFGVWVLLGLAGLASVARAQTVSVSLELDSAVWQVGEPIHGRIVVDVKGAQPGTVVTAQLLCSARASQAPIQGLERFLDLTAERRRVALRQFHLGLLRNEIKSLRSFRRTVQGDQRTVIPFSAADGVRLTDFDTGGPLSPGKRHLGVLACLQGGESYELDLDTTEITVKALVPRVTIVSASVDPTTPPRPSSPFDVILKYEIQGLPTDPGRTVTVRRQASVKERTPLKDRPYQNSNASTVAVPGSSDGKGRYEKRWRATLTRAGTYDFTFDLTCPGFLNASKTLAVTVAPASGGSSVAPPSPSGKATEWALEQVLGDPDRLEGKALRGGTIQGVSASGFTANYDGVTTISNGYAPNSLFKVALSGSPPARLRAGDKFQMTLSATGAKIGMDKCVDGREPGEQASANIGVSSHLRVTATGHANGMRFPDGSDGNSVAVGGYFGQWWSSDSRTYTVEVTGADREGPLVVSAYFPGFGQFARWVYSKPKPSTSGTNAVVPMPVSKLEPAEEAPPLTVALEPDTIVVSPRNAMGVPVTLLIKGDRPNWRPVEVAFDTVDARGTLRMSRYLKLEGKGSRETGDMWKANDGYFHWNLTALANLGIEPGSYVVPITVRQPGHGEVVRFLTILVPFEENAPIPPVTPVPRPTSLSAQFEVGTLALKAGGIATRNRLIVAGFAEGPEPVSVLFPDAENGLFPGGVRVLPGGFTVAVADAEKAMVGGIERLVLDLTFSAESGAPVGTRTIRAVVRQGDREAPAILVVSIARS